MNKSKNNNKEYFEEIKSIENIYTRFSKKSPLLFPKPINLQEEKKMFFSMLKKNEVYNPQLIYEKPKFSLDDVEVFREEINNISLDDDVYNLKRLYKEKLLGRFLQVGYHEFWGTEKSCEYALKYWKKPSLILLLKAKKICNKYINELEKNNNINNNSEKIKKSKNVSLEFCAEELRKEVKRLTGDEIKIKFENINAKVNIEPSEKLIQINKNVQFTSLDVERLKVHEVGVHYMRYYNGLKCAIKLFETGTENYLETEEGLAAYNEYDKGVLSEHQMFVYAGRVIATYYCISKSFYEIFKILKKYKFDDNDCFAITFRAKRNLCDTSLKGGFSKDYVYLKGFEKVKKFAKSNDINKLFIGKVSIENLKLIDEFINENYDNIQSPFKKISMIK